MLDQIEQAAKKKGIDVTMCQIEQMHLAHEFYYYLEDSGAGNVSQTSEPVQFGILGLFTRRCAVRSLREIAAHTFAQKVCAADFHPLAWDWLILNEESSDRANEFMNLCRVAEQSVRGV